MCKIHMALQVPQAVVLMPHRMVLHFTVKVVALHLYTSTAKAYRCNQDGTVSMFLSRLTYCLLCLANKSVITLIPAYIPTSM